MTRLLIGLRAAYGVLLLAAPADLLSRLARTPVDSRARTVARVLGARQLLQAELTRRHPTKGWQLAGAGVDGLHAATMIALARADPVRRSLALPNAGTAALLGLAGVLAAWPWSPGASRWRSRAR